MKELCLRLKPGGLLFAAPPCSTFVWMNRGTSGRSKVIYIQTSEINTVVKLSTVGGSLFH